MDHLQTGWMCEHNKARGKEESNERICLVSLILKEVTFKIKTNDFITTGWWSQDHHMQDWMVSSVFVWLLAAVLPNVCVSIAKAKVMSFVLISSACSNSFRPWKARFIQSLQPRFLSVFVFLSVYISICLVSMTHTVLLSLCVKLTRHYGMTIVLSQRNLKSTKSKTFMLLKIGFLSFLVITEIKFTQLKNLSGSSSLIKVSAKSQHL